MRLIAIASMALALLSVILFLIGIMFDIFQKPKQRGVIELTKADCIETCIRILQTEQLFPDYHRTVQKCNDLFAEVETCRLAK